ncbi:MAG: FMN-binding negative transcriptional regulator [Oricola sp.]
MYQPPHFREERPGILHAAVRAHPLGLLICTGDDGPLANPVPFLLDTPDGGTAKLRAHVARANPAWKAIAARPETPVLVVFQGPQAYVTPSWYETKKRTGKVVPTWNYVMVQARGRATVIEDPEWLRGQIGELTDAHEARRAGRWKVDDAPADFIAMQIRGIVGLSVEVAQLEGKWKVSQNRPVEDRAGVAAGYRSDGNSEMEELVRAFGDLGTD